MVEVTLPRAPSTDHTSHGAKILILHSLVKVVRLAGIFQFASRGVYHPSPAALFAFIEVGGLLIEAP